MLNNLLLNPYHLYVKRITFVALDKFSFLRNYELLLSYNLEISDFGNFHYVYLIFSFNENGMSHESLDQPESGSKRAPSGVNETNYNLILICQLASCHLRGAHDAACSTGAQNTDAWSSVSDKKSEQ